jgi:hypothetical protein
MINNILNDLDNNRGITLTSNVNKVFSKSLETLICLSSVFVWYISNSNVSFKTIYTRKVLFIICINTILGETQGAFRKDGRIEDQIFPLQGIASLYKSSKKVSFKTIYTRKVLFIICICMVYIKQ